MVQELSPNHNNNTRSAKAALCWWRSWTQSWRVNVYF
ncbi:Trp operon leader peptide [Vibrio sp. 10N.286.49.B3]|nr:Trp operon leader peptide [Vibrio sp. 10N.286.49.B3]